MKKIMSIRVDEDLKEQLEKAAADDGRTLSQYVERLILASLAVRQEDQKPAPKPYRKKS
jgi:predicted HicB family RNase H-like nuclease